MINICGKKEGKNGVRFWAAGRGREEETEGSGVLVQVGLALMLALHILAWGVKEWTFRKKAAPTTHSASKCVY